MNMQNEPELPKAQKLQTRQNLLCIPLSNHRLRKDIKCGSPDTYPACKGSRVLGIVEMTSGLVHAIYSLPEWQAVT